ncbi:NAD(P)-binding domain-containing protein, partial [Pseudomonas sp. SB113]|uniref:NAD(P)-dependent oxidoreductase n=1 Tax=Pseudomonas sp. SB113 TaxID=3154123 RepID=UPI00345D9065
MAVAIAGAGHDLHVWARNPASYAQLSSVQHTQHKNLEQFAQQCEFVALCVRSDEDVLEVLQSGLIAGLRADAVIINHGTGQPRHAARVAELCKMKGINALDSPVSGGRSGAEERRLTTFVGGSVDVAERSSPVFLSYCKSVFYMGDH